MRPSKDFQKAAFAIGAVVLLTVGIGVAGKAYRDRQVANMPPPVPRARLVVQPGAPVAADSQVGKAADSSATNAAAQQPAASRFEISLDPMDSYQDDLRESLLQELAPAFPDLPKFLREPPSRGPDPAYERLVFQLLDAAENRPADQRPARLLAADLVANTVTCPVENKEPCNQLRSDFAEHKLTLAYSELGGGFYYQRDLLWRVWQQDPETDWGERAFVLLLESGWDTSTVCAKGSDQFREVIGQGESFLRQHPASRQRAVVLFLVGQAYATWWSLGNETADSGMGDYVDPKRYNDGAEPARVKAIGYFEQVEEGAPDTKFAEYARQILPALGEHKIQNNYKFFCVYD